MVSNSRERIGLLWIIFHLINNFIKLLINFLKSSVFYDSLILLVQFTFLLIQKILIWLMTFKFKFRSKKSSFCQISWIKRCSCCRHCNRQFLVCLDAECLLKYLVCIRERLGCSFVVIWRDWVALAVWSEVNFIRVSLHWRWFAQIWDMFLVTALFLFAVIEIKVNCGIVI